MASACDELTLSFLRAFPMSKLNAIMQLICRNFTHDMKYCKIASFRAWFVQAQHAWLFSIWLFSGQKSKFDNNWETGRIILNFVP